MLETDLYPPIKTYLELNGYQVNAEVKDCDIVASKENDIIVVELKTSINLTLLAQAVLRQSISDSVYIAVPIITRHITLAGSHHPAVFS